MTFTVGKLKHFQVNLSYQSRIHWTAHIDSSNFSTFQCICHRPILDCLQLPCCISVMSWHLFCIKVLISLGNTKKLHRAKSG